MKDGVPFNGNWCNCRLSSLLDLSPTRRVGGSVHFWANSLAIGRICGQWIAIWSTFLPPTVFLSVCLDR